MSATTTKIDRRKKSSCGRRQDARPLREEGIVRDNGDPAFPVEKRPAVPDLAMQFSPPLASWPTGLMVDAAEEVYGEGVDIRVRTGSAFSGAAKNVGIWLTRLASDQEDARRHAALNRLDTQAGRSKFAFFMSAEYVKRLGRYLWMRMPKRYTTSGLPSSRGPLHLLSMKVALSPERTAIVTTFKARYRTGGETINYMLVFTDKLLTVRGRLHCVTTVKATPRREPNEDFVAKFLNAFRDVLVGVIAFFVPYVGPTFWVMKTLAMNYEASWPALRPGSLGVGAAAAKMIPAAFLIPLGLKVAFTYKSVKVTRSGVYLRGDYGVVNREPSVSIVSMIPVKEIRAQPKAKKYGAGFHLFPEDLRGPLKIRWSTDPKKGTLTGATKATCFGKFDVRHTLAELRRLGILLFDHSISVKVVDADNLSAEDTLNFVVRVEEEKPEPPLREEERDRERP